MGLENNDKFLTTLGCFQAEQSKSSKWISVTIKRDRVPTMKKQLSKKKRQQAIESLKSAFLQDTSQSYSIKYKAKFGAKGSSTENRFQDKIGFYYLKVVPEKAISECNQLVNVFRLHFFSEQRNPKTKLIKKEASKQNPKSQNAKRRQERHKRNVERRRKANEIKILNKKKKQQGLNAAQITVKSENSTQQQQPLGVIA